MRTALFVGSFNPPTLAHLNIIEKGAKLFDQLIVAVAHNHKKSYLFSVEERIELLRQITHKISNVKIYSFSGLTINFANEKKVSCLIRGIKACSSLETEYQMALANRKMGDIETLFLLADEKFSHISSSLVREIGSAGGTLDQFVPLEIHSKILDRFSEK